LLGFFNATKPRILVLHSGTADTMRVVQTDRGIREALAENRRPLSVEWNYLGVDLPNAARRVNEARAQASRAIARFNPDVLIAVDDEANALVARDYAGRKRPRILYVSLNRPPADYGYDGMPNVSGIAERLPLAGVKAAVQDLTTGKRLAVLGVDNETGRAEMAQVKEFDWLPLVVSAAALVSTFSEWKAFVESVAAADLLLVLGTNDLPDGGRVATAAEINRWTQDHAQPLPVGTQVDFVSDGGGLSFAPPPDDSGARAVGLALDWLDARDTPGAPAPVVSDHFEVAVRPDRLSDRGILMPPIYIEAARENGTLFR
jgi:hypothetical protein